MPLSILNHIGTAAPCESDGMVGQYGETRQQGDARTYSDDRWPGDADVRKIGVVREHGDPNSDCEDEDSQAEALAGNTETAKELNARERQRKALEKEEVKQMKARVREQARGYRLLPRQERSR